MENKSYERVSKRTKELLSIVPGSSVGSNVVDGDLSYAIRNWKRKVKDDGRLREFYNRREFIKPSARRRKQKQDAVYRQKMGKYEIT